METVEVLLGVAATAEAEGIGCRGGSISFVGSIWR